MRHGGYLEGRATGQLHAVRLKYLSLETAIDLDKLIGAITEQGHGNGSVTLYMVNGDAGDMEMAARVHRKRLPRKIRLEQVS